jgi:argininosuccinate synthase
VTSTYAALVKTGGWFSPAREPLDALVAKVHEQVTGVSRVRLLKGDCRVVARWSSPAGAQAASS